MCCMLCSGYTVLYSTEIFVSDVQYAIFSLYTVSCFTFMSVFVIHCWTNKKQIEMNHLKKKWEICEGFSVGQLNIEVSIIAMQYLIIVVIRWTKT